MFSALGPPASSLPFHSQPRLGRVGNKSRQDAGGPGAQNRLNHWAAALAALALLPAAAAAQSMTAKGDITGPYRFPEQGGPAIYKGVCQGCHMPDGMGATGAATYPALARDPRLAAAPYPILRVLAGHGAMPAFKTALDDEQIAQVVGYIRTNFGNAYPAKVTAAQVKALRGG